MHLGWNGWEDGRPPLAAAGSCMDRASIGAGIHLGRLTSAEGGGSKEGCGCGGVVVDMVMVVA